MTLATCDTALPIDAEAAYERYHSGLVAFIRRRFNITHEHAEDVAQHAWTVYLEKGHRCEPTAVHKWLHTVAAHHFINGYRRNKRWRPAPDDIPIPQPRESKQCERVSKAMTQLNDFERRIVQVIYYDNLSIADAAEQLGLTPNALKCRLKRLRASLRELLQAT